MRVALLLLFLAFASGCGPPRCPPVPVTHPVAEATVPWLESARPRVQVGLGGQPRTALLDTGWPRSAIALAAAGEVDLGTAELELGGASAGPLAWDPLLAPPEGADLIAGADVLSQLPLVLDARAATARLLPAFTPGAGAAPLTRWSSGLCRGDRSEGGPEGPDLLLVEATLDGQPRTFALDTGADITLVRQSAIPNLADRPTLSGIPLQSGFAGTFIVIATRARALSIGGQASPSAPLLFAPQIDAHLDALLQRLRGGPARLDGFLGRSFLREFEVSLALGDGGSRALGLARFDTQSHWSRDFVGVGIATAPSTNPAGLRIAALYSRSPARDAGLQVGDVILFVEGTPAVSRPTPWGAPGATVQLVYQRGPDTLTATVTITDLLPDPP